jgi:hypothetical protein
LRGKDTKLIQQKSLAEEKTCCVRSCSLGASLRPEMIGELTKAQFSYQKILQNFLNFPSHRIFRHMHEALNIDKK